MSNDLMLTIAKCLIEGDSSGVTKAQWYEEIAKRAHAKEFRLPDETQQQAFTRFITQDERGRLLFAAHRRASGPDWQPPQKIEKNSTEGLVSSSMSEIERLAEELRATNPKLTKEQAVSQVLETPQGQKLYRKDKAEQLKKSLAFMG